MPNAEQSASAEGSEEMSKPIVGCQYQGYEFGARYPDSVCIDGRLLDADDCDDHGNLYDHENDIPCPMCRPREAVIYYFTSHGDWFENRTERVLALSRAKSLVADIRKNRGVESDWKALKEVRSK